MPMVRVTGGGTTLPSSFSKYYGWGNQSISFSVTDATVGEVAIVTYVQRGTVALPVVSGMELQQYSYYQGDDAGHFSNVICIYRITNSTINVNVTAITFPEGSNGQVLLYN